MQGATELALIIIIFLGLQIWWMSKVLLVRSRRPKALGQSKPSTTLEQERRILKKIYDQT